MRELTLKELAPYLPYGLYFYCIHDVHEKNQLMTGLSKEDGIQTDYTKPDNEGCNGNLWSFKGNNNYRINGVSPIVRPLIDLTKPITHNGESFLGYDEFSDNEWNRYKEMEGVRIVQPKLITNILDYNCTLELIKRKFDVFGLIEDGLAIDVNTLDINPYK